MAEAQKVTVALGHVARTRKVGRRVAGAVVAVTDHPAHVPQRGGQEILSGRNGKQTEFADVVRRRRTSGWDEAPAAADVLVTLCRDLRIGERLAELVQDAP